MQGAGALRSLEQISLEPVAWWNLTLSHEGNIKVASLWEGCMQWFYAWFTDQLKTDLCGRVGGILETLPVDNVVDQQERQITVEKVGRLIHSPDSWLYGIRSDIENPPVAEGNPADPIASPIQPHEEGGRYYNFPGEKIWSQFLTTLYLLFPGTFVDPTNEDLKTWHRVNWIPLARSMEPKITWLGHAGVLIQAANMNFLLDPVFHFVSPCFFRHTEPPIPLEKLPLIDVLGISHNHGDHFEQPTVLKFAPFQPFAFLPSGVDSWFTEHGFEKAEGKKWWQRSTVTRDGQSVTMTAIPAQHGACTGVSDLNKTLWMGFMIEVGGMRIYCAGDTGYNRDILEEIKKQFGTIDLACLPIAPEGEPEMHFDQNQALDALEILEVRQMIPIHYGAYRTGVEKIEDPLRLLGEAAKRRGLEDRIIYLKLGETFDLKKAEEEENVI